MGHAARARILSMFTLEQSLAVFGDLYRQATGRISSAQVLKGDQDRARRDVDRLHLVTEDASRSGLTSERISELALSGPVAS